MLANIESQRVFKMFQIPLGTKLQDYKSKLDSMHISLEVNITEFSRADLSMSSNSVYINKYYFNLFYRLLG